jgi:signal transduction histidine kinase
VYGIVSQAGGTVTLDSELGRGTRVTIDLPARERLYPPTLPRSEQPVA